MLRGTLLVRLGAAAIKGLKRVFVTIVLCCMFLLTRSGLLCPAAR